ncbi:MAG: hypothetical protein JWL70_2595 [Acidimicrobiia bacterium]|nr:hypothetical protein [Acidimicrobiia bacterium]
MNSSNGHKPVTPLLELRDVEMQFSIRQPGGWFGRRAAVRAVDTVSLNVLPGETLGLVGESGSGKSTLGRVALRLLKPTGGSVMFDGQDITGLHGSSLRSLRRHMQMVFQDPYSSLDPLQPVGEGVTEPLRAHTDLNSQQQRNRAAELLSLVGLPASHLERYPRELSGGQLQRLSIARALAVNPKLLVLDEPVSALDVSTQAQVINLLSHLQRDLALTFLLIAHSPALVHHVSNHIAVMYLGRIVESGSASAVYKAPKHPYTRALLSAVPVPDPVLQRSNRRIVLSGDVPDPTAVPSGCRFHTRCPWAMEVCHIEDPAPYAAPDGTTVNCHLHTAGPQLAGRSVLQLPLPAGLAESTTGRSHHE